WTPSAYEGTFTIGLTVKNVHAGTSGSATIPFTLTSRLVAGHATVNPTSNALVALFTGLPCLKPNSWRVRYTPASAVPPNGISTSSVTATIPCRVDGTSAMPDVTS